MPTKTPHAFSAFEWMIAWRYLRARRQDGGVSIMTWISFIGIMLAVAALIITLAVRSGFRAEFVDTILGSNAHITVYSSPVVTETGKLTRDFKDYDAWRERILTLDDVTRAAPMVRAQVMASFNGANAGIEVYGMSPADMRSIPRVAQTPDQAWGDVMQFENGIALGSGIARDLGLSIGDRVKLISPEGAKTAFGTSPRVSSFEVVYVFSAGRYDIDKTRAYLPLEDAQKFFNKDNAVNEIEVMVRNPEDLTSIQRDLTAILPNRALLWTWKDSSGAFLRALDVEDNVMFVILSVLVTIASLNIVSGLIMLVKNKGRDIGILRTIGLSQGSIMRVFFICGALTGVFGTIFGVILGVAFASYIDQILAFINFISGQDVWSAEVRGIYALPAELRLIDIFKAASLSLGLSCIVTIIPARKAARMNPVDALRYE